MNNSLKNLLREMLSEAKKEKPSAGLTKKQKSAVAKKARAGKDIGKKGKGFEMIAKKAAKKYGSEEKGRAVAAASMWKNIKREGVNEMQDHEVSMAVKSLESIMSSASELLNKLGNQERNIPGWIQDHITNAENYIDQAAQGFHELGHEGEEDEEEMKGPSFDGKHHDAEDEYDVVEKKLTAAEKNKKEEIIKSMAKKMGGKHKLKPVNYAAATKTAIKKAE